MSLGVDHRRAGTQREHLRALPENPRCHVCGAPCFSFGWPMYPADVHVCGAHAKNAAADWYARWRAAL